MTAVLGRSGSTIKFVASLEEAKAKLGRILRYDRAPQKLLESQQRRRKAQVRVSV